MSNQLIKFKTAQLAKKKGFDIPVNNYYDRISGLDNGDGDCEFINLNHNKYDELHSAPTQSTLQTWLRVEHDIEVVVHRDLEVHYQNEVKWVVSVNNWNAVAEINTPIAVLSRPQHTNKIDFTSYEDALEEGLRIGLNYIP